MRIVAGVLKGRSLSAPRSRAIRPTADRVRESLFNVLGQSFAGGSVLDLYAGTGAFAFEALSRGMTRAVLVDSGAEAAELCTRNAAALGVADRVRLLRLPVASALDALGSAGERFALVFADPPYTHAAVPGILDGVVRSGVLDPEGTLLVEHSRREVTPEAYLRLLRFDARRFGDTVVAFYRFRSDS